MFRAKLACNLFEISNLGWLLAGHTSLVRRIGLERLLSLWLGEKEPLAVCAQYGNRL
jgi:hypothetical protein